MNDSDQFGSPTDLGSGNRELHQDHEVLRKLFVAALVAMLILSGSLAVFLIRQVIFVRRDLEGVRPQVERMVATFHQVEEPQINSFVTNLLNFARTHPDFNPILAKYQITPGMMPIAPTAIPSAPAKK